MQFYPSKKANHVGIFYYDLTKLARKEKKLVQTFVCRLGKLEMVRQTSSSHPRDNYEPASTPAWQVMGKVYDCNSN